MSEEEVIRIHCSNCRSRIPVTELFEGKAMSVGQYCFCRRCLDENEVEEIRRIKKLSVATGRQRRKKKVVY